MKLGLKEKELQLSQNLLDINDINIKKNDSLLRNNDLSSTKEDENIIYDEPIEYCSSPKIGLVSIHGSRNKNNLMIKFTEDKTDIPNTVSMYINPIKTELVLDNNYKTDKNMNLFFQKKQQTHKIEKYKEKKSIINNNYTTNIMKKPIKSEKYNSLNHKFLEKKIDKKKKIPKKVENEKNEKVVKKWEKEKPPRDKMKQFKRKSTSYSISALSEKMIKIKNKLTQNQEIKEKSKEENKDSDEDNHKKKKKKEGADGGDMTPNIIIYGSESSDNNNEESNIGDNSNKHKNSDDFFKTKNYSNVSTSNPNNLDKTETKIVKPRSKPSGSVIYTRIKKMNGKKKQNAKEIYFCWYFRKN